MSDADFVFNTNIDEVARRIEQGLQQIVEASSRSAGNAPDPLQGLAERIQQEVTRSISEMRRLDEATRNVGQGGGGPVQLFGNVSRQLDELRANVRRQLDEALRGSGGSAVSGDALHGQVSRFIDEQVERGVNQRLREAQRGIAGGGSGTPPPPPPPPPAAPPPPPPPPPGGQQPNVQQLRAQRAVEEQNLAAQILPRLGGTAGFLTRGPGSATRIFDETDLRNPRFFQQSQSGLREINQGEDSVNFARAMQDYIAVLRQRADVFGRDTERARASMEKVNQEEERLAQAAAAEARAFSKSETRLLTERLATEQAGGHQGLGANFLGGLTSAGFGGEGGFSGNFDGLARAAGTSAKYAVIGQTLFGLQNAAQQAAQEMLDAADSVTELEVAMGRGSEVTQDFQNKLQDFAAVGGFNVGEAMDVAASGIRAFASEAEAAGTPLDQLGEDFAKQASRIAVISKTTLTDASGNLKAIASGFDLSKNDVGFGRVADAIAGAKTAGGGDEKQIGQGLANSALVFKQAGFSVEEAATIVSKIIAQTDQSGQLVATKLSRITSTLGGTSGKKALTDLNGQLAPNLKIDTNADESTQIHQLAAAYGTLSDAQKQVINNQIGGQANQREFIVLMKEMADVTKQVADGFQGRAIEEYNRRLLDLRATLNTLVGDIKNITVNVANSGALDPLIAGIEALKPALKIILDLTQAFDSIPRPLRTAAFALAEFALALKGVAAVRAAGGIRGFIGGLEQNVAPGRAAAALALRNNLVERESALREVAGGAPNRQQQAILNDLETQRLALERRFNLGLEGAAAQRLAAERADAAAAAAGATAGPRGLLARSAQLQADALRTGVGSVVGGARQAGIVALSATPREVAATAGRGLAAAGRGVGALAAGIGPIGGALIGAELGFELKGAADDLGKARREAAQELAIANDGTAAALRNSAANLKSAASNLDQASSGFFGSIADFAQHNAGAQEAARLNLIAGLNSNAATRIDRIQSGQRAGAGGLAGVAATIDTSSAENVTSTLKALADSGQPAAIQLQALNLAINGLDFSAGKSTANLTAAQKQILAINAGTDSTGQFGALAKQLTDRVVNPAGNTFSTGSATGDRAFNAVQQYGQFANPVSFLVGRLPLPGQRTAERVGQTDPRLIQAATEQSVRQALAAGADLRGGAGEDGLRRVLEAQYNAVLLDPAAAAELAKSVADSVAKRAGDLGKATDSLGVLTAAAQGAIAPAQKAGQDAALQSQLQALRTGGQDRSGVAGSTATRAALAQSRQAVEAKVKAAIAAGATPEQANLALAPLIEAQGQAEAANLQAIQKQAEDDIAVLEEARKHGQANAKNKAQIKAVGEKYLRLEAVKAAQAGDTAALIAILDNANKAEIKVVVDAINESNKVQSYALSAAQATARAAATLAGSQVRGGAGEHSGPGGDLTPEQVAARDAADRAQATLKRSLAQSDFNPKSVYATGSDVQSIKDGQKKGKKTDTAAQIEAARVTANAQNAGGEAVLAAAAILTAKADVAAATKNTVAYYKAIGQLYQAQQQQRQAILDIRRINDQFKSDLTDPVAQAKIDVDIANQKLLQDKARKASPDVINKDTVDLRTTQNQAESAAFSQRLSDVQTADQLGQISHAAYLKYLTSEHNRLVAVKSRTRQQQDELNQIDTALKSAADALSGQFNIGDIRVPTPYEARRYIAASTAGVNYNGGNSSTTIYIDGTDTGLVQQIINQSIGTSATTRTVVTSRKVGAA